MPRYVYVHVCHTHLITEALCLVTQVQLFLMTVNGLYSAGLLYLIGLVSMMHFNSKATPTIVNDCSYHLKAVKLVNQSYGVHITPHHATSY